MSAARHLAIVGGWDAALAAYESDKDKPTLEDVMEGLDDRITSQTDAGVTFYCPLHDDRGKPSGWLKVSSDPTDPDSYSARCYACEGDNSRWWADFATWVTSGEGEGTWSSKEVTSTLPRSGSKSRGRRDRVCECWYDYRDAEGNLVGRKFRYTITEEVPDSLWRALPVGKSFSWETDLPLKGAQAPLYRLPEVLEATASGDTVWVVEGEKDADTMASIGLCGTTGPNGANPWTDEQVESLRGAEVVIVADRDNSDKGLKHAKSLYWRLKDVCTSVEMKIPSKGFKDVTNVFVAHGSVLEYLEDVPAHRPHLNPLTMALSELKPRYLRDADGRYMLYPGEIHIVYGAPGTFKSLLSLDLVAPDARFLDFENGPVALRERLTAMKSEPERSECFDFPETAEQVLERVQEYCSTKPSVVVIDGLPGLCGVLGIDSDNNAEVQGLFSKVLVPMKNAGICVVLLDHIPKDAAKPEYPIGAQAKKAQCGVAYLLQRNAASGTVELFVAKDRHHVVASRCEPGPLPYYGSVVVTNGAYCLQVEIVPERVAHLGGQTLSAREGRLLQEVWDFIGASPGCSKNTIETSVTGKNSAKRDALNRLIEGGYVEVRRDGPAQRHYVRSAPPVEWLTRNADLTS